MSCATVHQFQGSESDVIVFDAVESYPKSAVGYLMGKEPNQVARLINVAITRGKCLKDKPKQKGGKNYEKEREKKFTDWMGLVPGAICISFAGIGLVQLIKRRSLFRVDADIMILGVYFVIVFLAYAIFEMIPINYRPILIEGRMEAS